MTSSVAISRLSEVSATILDCNGIESLSRALDSNYLTARSTAIVRSELTHGNTRLEEAIRELQLVWRDGFHEISGTTLSMIVRTAAESVRTERNKRPTIQVVWTGPQVDGSYLRATGPAIREVINCARNELLIVGYWIAADDGEGVVSLLMALIADAISRGVTVTMVLDPARRVNGQSNRETLLRVWPRDRQLPALLTWREPLGSEHLKLHAKVLVADRADCIVTSANLTMHAMERNIELGVRVTGCSAAYIAHHFDLLAAEGILENYTDEIS